MILGLFAAIVFFVLAFAVGPLIAFPILFLIALAAGFAFGFKRLDRVRGTGWLVCPHCGESASQDVVDEMQFAALGYRFTPVRRHRVLLCRRCRFKRAADDEEMRQLETAGQPIHHAWMFPVGLVLPLIFLVLVQTLIFSTAVAAPSGITFTTHPTKADSANPYYAAIGGQLSFPGPDSWNYVINRDDTPPKIVMTDTAGDNLGEFIIRDPQTTTLQGLTDTYFANQSSINDNGFPKVAPAGTCVKVGGENANMLTINFKASGQDAVVLLWAVVHEHVGYVFTFTGNGPDGVKTITATARYVMANVSFTGHEPKPTLAPGATPSPTPSATPTPSPSPTPGPSTEPSPGATPTATPEPTPAPVHCG